MINKQLTYKMEKAIYFLNNHPGVNQVGDFFSNNLNWFIVAQCVRNHYKDVFCEPRNVEVQISSNHPKFKEYVEQYGEEDDKQDLKTNDIGYISVPYSKVYGERWKYNHTTYVGEFSWFKIQEQFLNEKIIKHSHFNCFQGERVEADSWEKLIIKIADTVKKYFGDFTFDSFITEDEKKNHEKEEPFFFIPIKHDDKQYYEMVENPQHVFVSSATMSDRWFKWFEQTQYYKEKWSES